MSKKHNPLGKAGAAAKLIFLFTTLLMGGGALWGIPVEPSSKGNKVACMICRRQICSKLQTKRAKLE